MPHLKFIVVGAVIIGAVTYLMFSGISDSMVYYYTLSELYGQSQEVEGKGIRVTGHVEEGSIREESSKSRVEFVIFEKTSDYTLPVVYQGIIPDTFKDNSEVVVEGVYDHRANLFQANVLLAKCPSKYEALGEEHPEEIENAPVAGKPAEPAADTSDD